ncbi:MAG: ABC transporter ATP-binding protein [Treponemataceae bacterium]
MNTSLIEVQDLVSSFRSPAGPTRVVDGISFTIPKGKVLGMVGESGCGKSITSLSIMRLLPQPNGFIESGRILFDGTDLLELSLERMENIRGNEIAMVFQEPMTALNPIFSVGEQIGEVLQTHRGMKGRDKKEKAVELLRLVGIPRPDRIAEEYPHQLSGGMRQRVMIAMALSCDPKLLIADEPTTALDVTIQIQILDLIRDFKDKLGTSILFITHDLGVIAEMADEVAVMYLGKIVELASVCDIFDHPSHPYTKGLMESRLVKKRKGDSLICIPGMVPSLTNKPKGCAFSPRCSDCMDICRRESPELKEISPAHFVRCWLSN